MRAFMLRIGFSVALMATLGLTALPGYAAEGAAPPTLVVANPSPGDMLTPGALVMQGVAFDPVATDGIGVDRVSVFIGDRDAGGAYLGDAALGKPNFMTDESAQFGSAGWALTTPVLKGFGDGETLFIYARSGVTGIESVMQIPVVIGEKHTSSGATVVTEPTGGAGDTGTPSD